MKSQSFHSAYSYLSGAAGRAGRLAVNSVMPSHCPLTGEAVAEQGMLGPSGWASLHFIEEPYCRRCGAPFAADYGEDVECPSCIAAPPVFDRARAAVVYDDASHRLIVGYKHSDRTELAPMFSTWLARAGKTLVSSDSILVPIPLHPRRLMSRRYNQSAMLARLLAKKFGAKLSLDGLSRKRSTPPQKNLTAEGRKRNVAGAFEASSNAFKDCHIVLIDDVLTTGATLSAAAGTVKRAGAAKVDALVIARVVKGGVGAI